MLPWTKLSIDSIESKSKRAWKLSEPSDFTDAFDSQSHIHSPWRALEHYVVSYWDVHVERSDQEIHVQRLRYMY